MHQFFRYCLGLFTLFIQIEGNGQSAELPQSTLNKLVNSAFSQLVTGKTGTNDLGSYGSFDPVDGSFTMKGTIPVGKNGRDTGRISFLGINLQGDLISDSYSALFSNSSLNTGASIRFDYNFQIGRRGLRFFGSDETMLAFQRQLLRDYRRQGRLKVDSLLASAFVLRRIDSAKLQLIKIKMDSNRLLMPNQEAVLNNNLIVTASNQQAVTSAADSLRSLVVIQEKLLKDSFAIRRSMDSLNFVLARDAANNLVNRDDINNYYDGQIESKYLDSLEKIIYAMPMTGFKIHWITLTAGINQKKYYTFTESLPFDEQIAKQELKAFRFGVAFNYYRKRTLLSRATYFNLGLAYIKDNNTALLSTTKVIKEKTIANGSGNTEHKVTKEYKAYVDPIEEFKVWNIYMNYYFIFGRKTNSGPHLFPGIDFRKDGKSVANVGVGYLVSLVNEKKDKPVINVEAYIKFIDVANELDAASTFWDRNEIGVSFTFPFNIFMK